MSATKTSPFQMHSQDFLTKKVLSRLVFCRNQMIFNHRSSVATLAHVVILAQVVVRVLCHFDHSLRIVLASFFPCFSHAQRLSQQTTQQASLLPDQSQCTPADVPVSDITIDAQSSPISNTGSPCSGSADIAMCRPVSHAACDGFSGTGVPPDLEAILHQQFATLSNNIARTHTSKWMQDQQARSIEIDKTLANLRASAIALQCASVSSAETKSASSDWPLPKIAVSASTSSNRRPSQSHTPGESACISQLPGKRQKPSFSPVQKAPKEWLLFLSDSLVVRTRTLSKMFAKFLSLAWMNPTKSSTRKAATMPVLCSYPKQRVNSSLLLTQVRASF